jgi:hypothetical protein
VNAQREWLDLLEELGEVERCVSIAWAAGAAVAIPDDELNEALRRALVVRAVGGSPQREVALDEDAVARLADELESPARRQELLVSIDALRSGSLGPRALEAADALLGDVDLAWRCFAAGQLAAELSL